MEEERRDSWKAVRGRRINFCTGKEEEGGCNFGVKGGAVKERLQAQELRTYKGSCEERDRGRERRTRRVDDSKDKK